MNLYFDNAATTFPKPASVGKAVWNSINEFGANPGRSAYKSAVNTAEMIYRTRLKIKNFFNAGSEEKVIFTHNCTTALNTVIQGLAVKNTHFVISSLEHNAVVRPLETLRQKGICDYSAFEVCDDDRITVENMVNCIRENTVAVVCTASSNVFGKKLPFRELAAAAHRNGRLFALDAAQAAGVIDINMADDGIDFLCVAAHKGLYAPMSAGILIIGGETLPEPLIQGGTGTLSALFTQPENLPERYESGTLSVPLIAGLSAGIDFIKKKGTDAVYNHEMNLIKYAYERLSENKNVVLYGNHSQFKDGYLPLLSFNVKSMHSEETAALLAQKSVCVRAGYHCAYSAHRAYKTEATGTVRIAPGVFNDKNDVNYLLKCIFEIAKR